MNSRIYLAAALFSARETAFNLSLAEHLAAAGYGVDLPQRDGFEFAALDVQLRRLVPSADIAAAVQQIIYHLDMGWFLPRCNVVLAVLDEPLDDGVLIEMAYARMGGIPIVGLRTDVRSPYGSLSDPGGGAHFFPYLQCDHFLSVRLPYADRVQAADDWQQMLLRLDRILAHLPLAKVSPPPVWQQLIHRANRLFAGINDLRSEAGVQAICQRLATMWPELSASMPSQAC